MLRAATGGQSLGLLLTAGNRMDVVIYHNPDCGTSRNTLGMIRNAGIEPHVIEYLKTPPARAMLQQLIARMNISVRALLREKGTPFRELGLGDPALSDDALLDAMAAHPDPHQPAHRRHAQWRAALPAIGKNHRIAAAATR